ncbi:MAG: alpha/beta fold hydrolase [Rhizobiaceae bacterium]
MLTRLRGVIAAMIVPLMLGLGGCINSPDRTGFTTAALPGTAATPAATERLFVATPRMASADPAILFSSGRSATLNYADLSVGVPGEREAGAINMPGRSVNPDKEFRITAAERLAGREAFSARLAETFAARPAGRRTAILYVHGFDVSFASGVFRQAQLMHDFALDGVAVHYSWPSAGRAALYLYDRDSADFARGGLAETLSTVVAAGAESVVVFAHSMGGNVVMEALRELGLERRVDVLGRIEAVVLAAPDIDGDLFRAELARIDPRPGTIVALVSPRDRALRMSSGLRGGRGRIGLGLEEDVAGLAALGVHVVDTTRYDQSKDPYRHNIFTGSPTLIRLLRNGGGLGAVARGKDMALSDGLFLATDFLSALISLPARTVDALEGG